MMISSLPLQNKGGNLILLLLSSATTLSPSI
jgi:hypothetical protein